MEILSMFIRKRNLKYHVMLEYRADDGTRKQKSLGSYDSSRKANNALVQEKAKNLNNDFIMPTKLTLEGYLNDWFKSHSKTLSITTTNRYRLILNETNTYMGQFELQKITPLMVKNFYSFLNEVTMKRKKGLSEKTKLQYHRVLSKAFKDAYKLQYINKNIMELVDSPKAKKYVADYLTPSEVKQLLKAVESTRYEVPVNLALGLGLRASEICGLTWDKINFKDKTVTIDTVAVWDDDNKTVVFKDPKSESSRRVIPAPDGLLKSLKKYRELQLSSVGLMNKYNLVFTNENGDPASARSFNTPYRNFIRRRNLKDIRFHDLRHTNASLMLLAGVDIKTASSRLGHSEIGITLNLYTHVLEQLNKEASDKLQNVIY